MQIDWTAILKTYGPLGVFCLAAVLLIWKKLVPYIERQHAEHIKALQATVDDARRERAAAVEDARKEREAARRLRERETERFLESLSLRDQKMERGFSELIVAIHRLERDEPRR